MREDRIKKLENSKERCLALTEAYKVAMEKERVFQLEECSFDNENLQVNQIEEV